MPNPSFADRLSVEDRAVMDRVLAARHYYGIEEALCELASHGITVSRSALARHMKKKRDRLSCMPDGTPPTVVTVVDRATGAARVLYSDLDIDEIERRIRPKS